MNQRLIEMEMLGLLEVNPPQKLQKIYPDLETMITRARSKKVLHIACTPRETQSLMIILDLANMSIRTSKAKVSRLVKNSKTAHQRIYLDLETMISQQRLVKGQSTQCMKREIRNTMIILDPDNMKHLTLRENHLVWVRNLKSAHQKICLDLEIMT